MNTLIQKSDLLNIIDYEKQRDTYRSELIDYKKPRRFKRSLLFSTDLAFMK